jgi:hypothetical protein
VIHKNSRHIDSIEDNFFPGFDSFKLQDGVFRVGERGKIRPDDIIEKIGFKCINNGMGSDNNQRMVLLEIDILSARNMISLT